MKRCPECRRDYYDDTLLYCLEDGNALVQGTVPLPDEPQTAILPESDVPGEAPTMVQTHATGSTAGRTSSETGGSGKTTATKRRGLLFAGVGLALVVIIVGGWYVFGDKLFSKPPSFAKISSEELFTGDSIETYALSPDGKLIAYFKRTIKENKDTKMVVVRQLASGAESVIREVDAESVSLWIESFSPDGEYIYFRERPVGGKPTLYKIATLGGSIQRVIDDVASVQISHDGKKIAFRKTDRASDIFEANIDGSGQRVVLAGADINAGAITLGGWSPDSTKLSMYYWRSDIKNESGGNASPYFVAVLDTAVPSGSATDMVRVLIEEDWPNDPRALNWEVDGNGLIFLANKVGSPLKTDIFYLSYPGGELRQLTDDAVNYFDLKVAADGKSIVARTGIDLTSLWSLDPKTKVAKRLTSEDKTTFPGSLTASADGRLFYLKRGKGEDGFYSVKQDGTDEKKLFSRKGIVDELHVTSDGKYFVTAAWPASGPGNNLYRMDADGSNEIQLTDAKDTFSFGVRLSSSGYIWFARQSGYGAAAPTELMRLPIGGGTAEKIQGIEPAFRSYSPALSPNEKLLAFLAVVKNEQTGKSDVYIRIVEMNDGVAGKKIIETNGELVPRIRWTPDSSAIIFERNTGHNDLFKIDLASKKETQISEFDTNMDTMDFVWSQDGTKILVFKFTGLTSLVRIKDISFTD